ncbi:sodium:proton antiporter [Rickettsia endosymbiont of Proechinophthirus fluctus]|nr:sodium:proton antiporter [Rickettsia endosymbiont of Proechinophthirus fluctus]
MRAAIIIGSLISALFGVAVLKYCTGKEQRSKLNEYIH